MERRLSLATSGSAKVWEYVASSRLLSSITIEQSINVKC